MNIGKKILSAFVEVSEDIKPPDSTNAAFSATPTIPKQSPAFAGKFREYFNKLFDEANIQGPDYYEFSKMTDAMNVIPDERARYMAAFAGLSVQGLDKAKLLSTAAQYLQVLETDASNFNNTINAVLNEKVINKKQEMEETGKRIQQLSQEIAGLQNKISVLGTEIKENQEKVESNNNGYQAALTSMKEKIHSDIEKIKQHIN